MPLSYYDQLKANLTADAAAKKAALDAIYNAYTQATFDESGGVSYKEPGKLGTRDVQFDTSQRALQAAGESAGMLRSGQQARNLATDLAGYKADVLGMSGKTTADKTAIDTAQATELAKYKAQYETGTGTGTGAGSTNQTPTDITNVAPAPVFKPDPSKSTAGLSPSRITSQYKTKVTPKKKTTPTRIGGY